MYSTITKNALFEGVVQIARDVRAALRSDAPEEIVVLDFADRALLDTNRLPFEQSEVRVSFENSAQQQLVAVVQHSDDTALVISQRGLLFHLTPETCESTDCIVPAGRLVRANGAPLDDIYDVLAVPLGGGTEYFVSFGEEIVPDRSKAFFLSKVVLPETPDPSARYSVEDVVFESTSFSLKNGHAHVSGGGGLAYDPDTDRIIVTVGDYGLNGYANRFIGDTPPAQDPKSDLGKIHAIDRVTGVREVLTVGHRNPQGLTRTRTGELISTEHGPKGGDEVNIIKAGQNYGWPNVTLGTLYERYTFPQRPLDATQPHGGFAAPLTAFVPSVGISALMEVQDLHPAWDGDLLIGSLKAQSLFRLRDLGGGHYIEQVHLGDRVRDMEIVNRTLLIASDAGTLYMLKPFEDVERMGTGLGLVTNKNALAQCGQCHNIGSPRSDQYAPHLVNVYGRPIASLTDYGGYSEGLMAREGEAWDEASLRAYLTDPQAFAPGTGMPMIELSRDELDEILELMPLLR